MKANVKDLSEVNGKKSKIKGHLIQAAFLCLVTVMLFNVLLVNKISSAYIQKIGREEINNIGNSIDRITNEGTKITDALSIVCADYINANGKIDKNGVYALIDECIPSFDNNSGVVIYVVTTDECVATDDDVTFSEIIRSTWYKSLMNSEDSSYVGPNDKDALGNKYGLICAKKIKGHTDCAVAIAYPTDSIITKIPDNNGGEKDVIFVAKDGTIIIYNDQKDSIGRNIYKYLPQYATIFDKLCNLPADMYYFDAKSDGRNVTVFFRECDNEIYSVEIMEKNILFEDRMYLIVTNTSLLLIIAMFITWVYKSDAKRKRMFEGHSNTRERMAKKVVDEAVTPLSTIIEYSDFDVFSQSDDKKAALDKINYSANEIKELVANIKTYLDANQYRKDYSDVIKQGRKSYKKSMSYRIAKNLTIILWITMVLAIFISGSVNLKTENSRLFGMHNANNGVVSAWYQNQLHSIDSISLMTVMQPVSKNSLSVVLNDAVNQNKAINRAFVYSADDNNILYTSNGIENVEEYILTQLDWYIGAIGLIDKDTAYCTGPFTDITTGENRVVISRAYRTNSGNVMIIGLEYSATTMSNILSSSYNDNSYAFLVSPDGTIINNPNRTFDFTAEKTFNVIKTPCSILFSNDKIFAFYDYNDVLSTGVSGNCQIPRYRLITVYSFEEIYGGLFRFALMIIVVFLFCIVYLSISMRKITKWQNDVNDSLQATYDQMAESNEAKNRFVKQMSHEFRVPINTVVGMNEMIKREDVSDEVKSYSENISRASKALKNLVDNILNYSEMENGNATLHNVDYNTKDIITALAVRFSPDAHAKGLNMELEPSPDLPLVLNGDVKKITQVVINLMSNAVKYTEKGKVTTKIDSFITSDIGEDEVYIRIVISDTGIGIKKEDINRVFDSFEKIDYFDNDLGGTGLGLPIVKRITELLDGKIEVDSEFGRGTTFTFEVKQKVIDPTPVGEFETERHMAARDRNESYLYAPKARILVTDDSAVSLKIFKGLLKRNCVQVDTALNGEECIRMAMRADYDLFFIDHLMPGMDGIELLNELRDKGLLSESSKTVAITSNVDYDSREFYISNGFDDFIAKPYDAKQLESVISVLLPNKYVNFKNMNGDIVSVMPEYYLKDAKISKQVGMDTASVGGAKTIKLSKDDSKESTYEKEKMAKNDNTASGNTSDIVNEKSVDSDEAHTKRHNKLGETVMASYVANFADASGDKK
ncbi:MAG: response regulator [Lachnospiraceae bacterium]|nr:response regulator [Candidatus Colinaster equi]